MGKVYGDVSYTSYNYMNRHWIYPPLWGIMWLKKNIIILFVVIMGHKSADDNHTHESAYTQLLNLLCVSRLSVLTHRRLSSWLSGAVTTTWSWTRSKLWRWRGLQEKRPCTLSTHYYRQHFGCSGVIQVPGIHHLSGPEMWHSHRLHCKKRTNKGCTSFASWGTLTCHRSWWNSTTQSSSSLFCTHQ